MLSEATQSGYERIRKSLFAQFKSTVSKKDIPSFHILTKNRPEVQSLKLVRESKLTGFGKVKQDQGSSIDPNSTTEESINTQQVAPALAVTQQEEEAALYFEGLKGNKDEIEGARLKGGYDDIIKKLKKKLTIITYLFPTK